MPVYRCTVANRAGALSRTLRQAPELDQVLRDLSSAGLYVLDARELDPRSLRPPAAPGPRALLELTEGLAMLLSGNVSLHDALELLEGVTRRREAKQLAALLRVRVEKGESLFAAAAGMGAAFPALYRAMLRIGERTGQIEPVMDAIARSARQRVELRDRMAAALAYPVLVLVLCVAVVAFLAAYVGPRLSALPAAMGSAAPDALVPLGHAFRGLAVAVTTVAALPALAAVALFVSPRRGGRWIAGRDRIVLRLPGIGGIVTIFEGRSLAFALEALARAGVPVEEALQEAAPVLRNRALGAAMERATAAVRSGASLSTALASAPELPRDLAQWAAIGERSGDVPAVFAHLSRSYAYRADRFLSVLTSMLEPALVVAVGGIVLWVVLSVVVPLFSSLGALVP